MIVDTPAPKRRGRPPVPREKMRARGSWRADIKEKPLPFARKSAKWRALSKVQMKRLIREIPGYNPHDQADGFTFDHGLANRALAFFPEELCHIEGAVCGEPFKLERWQQSIIANLFGWVRWSERWQRWVRRYREMLLYAPRKSGKSPLIAGVGLYVLFQDAEQGQQNYLAAASREQAGKLFRYAKAMIHRNANLGGRCHIYGGTAQAGQAKSIVVLPEETSFLQVISAEADSQHGGTAHLQLVDELHAQPSRDLIDTMTTSMASENRAEPLLVMVTTADTNGPSICNEKHDYAVKVRDGIVPDAAFLPVIFEAPADADWTDEKVWRACNPNLGVSVSLDYLRREALRARENVAVEMSFRRLHLNQMVESSVRAVDMERWDASAATVVDAAALAGRECYGGLDLSTTADLTAFVLVFPETDGAYSVLPWFWCPAETAEVRSRRDRMPYEVWARQGFIEISEGNVVDYDLVRRRINELYERYAIRQVGRDRWNATQITTQLLADGLPIKDFQQGFISMNAPTKELIRLVLMGKLRHGGHPVLRWNMANLSVSTDPAGNLKPDKQRSGDKIDGAVSLIMALGMAMAAQASVYEGRGMEVL